MSNARSYAIKRASIVALAIGVVGMAGTVFAHGPSHNPTRYDYVAKKGIPPEYKGIVNPLPMEAANVTAGQLLYNENCALCHGQDGDRPGEAAKNLKPPPAKLTGMYGRAMVGMGKQESGAHLMHGTLHHHPGKTHAEAMGGLNLDAYNFWAISEGGQPIGSAMPAFKEILSEKQRWQVLLYIASGFRVEPGK